VKTVISPYYPTIEYQQIEVEKKGYYRDVLLVKQEVSNLKKEDFSE
jgi:hypothetical protein